MTLEYLPREGFKIANTCFKWGEERVAVRKKLGYDYTEGNSELNLASIFESDLNRNIISRRDTYRIKAKNKNTLTSIFRPAAVLELTLHYDSRDTLRELEVKAGIIVLVEGIEMRLGEDTIALVEKLKEIDEHVLELEAGSFLFKNLHLNIANSSFLGGQGNVLSYLYAAEDISHLLE